MATSTFGKQFYVQPDKADEFVHEMTREVAPTLKKGFTSHLVHLTSDDHLKENLIQALNRK